MESIASILYLLMGILLFIIITALIYKLLRNHAGKPMTVPAKVIGKQTTVYDEVTKRLKPRKKDYIVSFACGNKKLYFATDMFVYELLEEGDTGTLKYKYGRFISFD